MLLRRVDAVVKHGDGVARGAPRFARCSMQRRVKQTLIERLVALCVALVRHRHVGRYAQVHAVGVHNALEFVDLHPHKARRHEAVARLKQDDDLC